MLLQNIRDTEHYQRWQTQVEDLMAVPRTKKIYNNVFPDNDGERGVTMMFEFATADRSFWQGCRKQGWRNRAQFWAKGVGCRGQWLRPNGWAAGNPKTRRHKI